MVLSSPTGIPKSVVIIPYFGRFGSWFPLFLDSLSRQNTLDLLLVTDAPTPSLPGNSRRLGMTLNEVRDLAEAKIGAAVDLERPYKLCDLKPAYGLTFEDYIQDYDYWAFADEDVIYGDLDRLLAPRLAEWPDMVIPNNRMTVGHLTLLRNTPKLKRLVLEEPEYSSILVDEANWGYPEASNSLDGKKPSFTRTVKAAEAQGDITVNWGLPILGDLPKRGRWVEYDGRSIRDSNGTELGYYHWGRMRHYNWDFPSVAEARKGFVVDSLGFRSRNLSKSQRLGRYSREVAMAAVRKGRRYLGLAGPPASFSSQRKTGA